MTTKTKPFTFLTYNIDGLNPVNLDYRTRSAASLILSQDPDVVHLQEVVHSTASTLISIFRGHDYVLCHGFTESTTIDNMCHYFTMSFCKKCYSGEGSKGEGNSRSVATTELVERCNYQGRGTSQQGRDFLKLKINMGSEDLLFINCHLESCGAAFKSPESATRQAQMEQVLQSVVQHNGPALMAGDLNIREPEAVAVIKRFPQGSLHDLAENLEGSRKSCTWFMPNKPNVKARYDRIYYNGHRTLVPKSYQVIGGNSIYDVGEEFDAYGDALPYNTPSDHRGLVVHFSVEGNQEDSHYDEKDMKETSDSHSERSNSRLSGTKRKAADESKLPKDVIDLTD